MIHLLNRELLCVTHSWDHLNQIMDALAQEGLEYRYKLRNTNRAALRQNPAALLEYRVYVRREDLGRARTLL